MSKLIDEEVVEKMFQSLLKMFISLSSPIIHFKIYLHR